MRTSKHLNRLCRLVLLIGPFLLALPANSAYAENTHTNPPSAASKTRLKEQRDSKYTGYEVDGRTSASVLTAKRSHSVARQDKVGLAVYSGVFVIGLIIFFAQQLNRKK